MTSESWYPTTGLLAQVGPDQGDPAPIPPLARFDDDDVELLARLMYAEAGNQNDDAMAGVGWNVINRIRLGPKRGFRGKIPENIFKPQQYSSIHDQRWTDYLNPSSLAPEDVRARDRARAIARGVLEGRIKDPTDHNVYFHSLSKNPPWLDAAIEDGRVVGPGQKIGGMTFLRETTDEERRARGLK